MTRGVPRTTHTRIASEKTRAQFFAFLAGVNLTGVIVHATNGDPFWAAWALFFGLVTGLVALIV